MSGMFSCSRRGLLGVQEGQLFVFSILVMIEFTQEEFLAPPWDWPKGQARSSYLLFTRTRFG